MTSDTYHAPYHGELGWSENFSGAANQEIAGSLALIHIFAELMEDVSLRDRHRLRLALIFKRQRVKCTIIWIARVGDECGIVQCPLLIGRAAGIGLRRCLRAQFSVSQSALLRRCQAAHGVAPQQRIRQQRRLLSQALPICF